MPLQLANILQLLLQAMSLLIIGRALTSWFDPGMTSAVGKFLFNATEPVIGPIRRFVPSLGVIDISPIIALILIQVLRTLIQSSI
jgi:YggT family protein